ncbi:SIS domain-containing protein [Deinococcus hopiensis]|uniref:Glucosamine--fructose-6-phosphate aminotransferase (Isomerizing) n=1 Tax=Deinococcus hopiensis KR-140 TaxID=695939 RepID=A0A1W1UKW1_9DEIO|nr:SIS domain-containing protein [Deinococcus hopiensis]SMB81717.1 glucosamine--fructose-6-phosphate aminotransferase (isomerizing) [Deinococcus hopiensis KR-140]
MSLKRAMMLQEAQEAPEVAARLLERNVERVLELVGVIKARDPQLALTIARGSSDHAATFAKYAIETQLGLPVASLAPSVTSVYERQMKLGGALVIGISQSGASPDIVAPLVAARQKGAITVAIVNEEGSPLAQAAEYVLPLHAGKEQAVAATKSYIASLIALVQLISTISPDEKLRKALWNLPAVLQETLKMEGAARENAERFRFVEHLIVLGRGLHLGIAQELALKLKETSGILAEAYSSAEFSHGPIRVVEPGFPVLALQADDETSALTMEAYRNLQEKGAALAIVGADAALEVPVKLVTPRTGHRITDPIAVILASYFLAGHLALHRGLNPDAPPSLSKVTLTV